MKQFLKNQRGASLIELIIALVLMGVFLSTSTLTILKNTRWMANSMQGALWVSEGHGAFRTLQKDFFHINKSNVVYVHPRIVVLQKSNQRIVYAVQRNTLYRNGQPILKHLKNQPVFMLLDEKNKPVSNVAGARFIEIRLKPQLAPNQWWERFYVED